MSKLTKAQQADRDEALVTLRDALKPGDTVQLLMRHVSRSGMRRVFDVYVIREGTMLRYSWSVAKALNWTYNAKHEGVQVDGCGMDMGFHLIYTLAHVLWPRESGPVLPDREDNGYALNYRHI